MCASGVCSCQTSRWPVPLSLYNSSEPDKPLKIRIWTCNKGSGIGLEEVSSPRDICCLNKMHTATVRHSVGQPRGPRFMLFFWSVRYTHRMNKHSRLWSCLPLHGFVICNQSMLWPHANAGAFLEGEVDTASLRKIITCSNHSKLVLIASLLPHFYIHMARFAFQSLKYMCVAVSRDAGLIGMEPRHANTDKIGCGALQQVLGMCTLYIKVYLWVEEKFPGNHASCIFPTRYDLSTKIQNKSSFIDSKEAEKRTFRATVL